MILPPGPVGHVAAALTAYAHWLLRQRVPIPADLVAVLQLTERAHRDGRPIEVSCDSTGQPTLVTAGTGDDDIARSLLGYDQAARLLECSPRTVRRLVARGELTPIRHGRRVTFTRQTIADYIARQDAA